MIRKSVECHLNRTHRRKYTLVEIVAQFGSVTINVSSRFQPIPAELMISN